MKYKITISEITVEEVPEIDYRNTHKKDKEGNEIWADVETGQTEIKTNEREIYTQEVEDLDIGELAIYINRSK